MFNGIEVGEPDSRLVSACLYGVKDFNHTQYVDYSNQEFTVYADYKYNTIKELDRKSLFDDQVNDECYKINLNHLEKKLIKGLEATYVVYGDSIDLRGSE